MRRSSWAPWLGVGETVATTTAIGGDGGARDRAGEGDRGEGRRPEECGRVGEAAWLEQRPSGGEGEDRQAGGVVLRPCARAGHTLGLLSSGKTTGKSSVGWAASWAGPVPGQQVAQVSSILLFISVF